MRILHVLDHSVPLQSGYSFRTLAILREQRRIGWQTFHLTSAKHTAGFAIEEEVEGWHFYRTPGSASSQRWFGMAELELMRNLERRLLHVLDAVKPDLMHVHSPVLNALPALRARRSVRIPVVYEVRALWEDGAVDHGTTHSGSMRYALSRMLETFALRRASRVTTICEGLRGELIGRGVNADRVAVIPNGVDCAKFAYDPVPDTSLLDEHRLRGKFVLGFIGSFYGYEGLELLVESLTDLRSHLPEVCLLLVGGGPREKALRALVAERNLQDCVVFAGSVPQREVGRFYSVCDLMVYPRLATRVTELVTPLKPLEAMAQGRLVLVSNVGGHRELVQPGLTGYLFEAGRHDALIEGIRSFLADRSQWDAVRRRARSFVEAERSWASSVERYAEVYRGALRDGS